MEENNQLSPKYFETTLEIAAKHNIKGFNLHHFKISQPDLYKTIMLAMGLINSEAFNRGYDLGFKKQEQ